MLELISDWRKAQMIGHLAFSDDGVTLAAAGVHICRKQPRRSVSSYNLSTPQFNSGSPLDLT